MFEIVTMLRKGASSLLFICGRYACTWCMCALSHFPRSKGSKPWPEGPAHGCGIHILPPEITKP